MRICARSLSNRCGQEHGVDLSTPQGRFFNPGHSIEVAWFLLHMCEVVPDDALSELALNVLEGSLEMGWDEAYGGGILYMMDVLGKPMVDATVTKDGKLWWPVTEALYALTYAYTMTNEEKWLAWLRKVHTYAYTYFADPDGGGEWFGYLNSVQENHVFARFSGFLRQLGSWFSCFLFIWGWPGAAVFSRKRAPARLAHPAAQRRGRLAGWGRRPAS